MTFLRWAGFSTGIDKTLNLVIEGFVNLSVHAPLHLFPPVGTIVLSHIAVRLCAATLPEFAECFAHGFILHTLSLASLLTTI